MGQIERKLKVLLLELGVLLAICVSVYALFEVINFFGLHDFSVSPLVSICLYFSVSLNFYFMKREIFNRNYSNKEFLIRILKSNVEFHEVLVPMFTKLQGKQDNVTIIRYGYPLSRALWLEGQFKTRVDLGVIIAEAAQLLGKVDEQASLFIDDIGWTSIILGETDNGITYIERGIDLANEIGSYFLVAKGHRHLVAIRTDENNLAEARRELELANEATLKIRDHTLKKEMIGGLNYAEAEILIVEKKYAEALKKSKAAKTIYEELKDVSRIAKIYSQQGRIKELSALERSEKQKRKTLLEAKDLYTYGLKFCQNNDRFDELIKNLLGLARIELEMENRKQARSYYAEIREKLESFPIHFGNLFEQLRKIEGRLKDE